MIKEVKEGYGIFNDETAMQYIQRWNPNPLENRYGDRSFSYSGYSSYFECPLRYFFKYIDRRKPLVPDNGRNALEGGAMHVLLENLVAERPDDITAWVRERARGFFDEYVNDMDACIWKTKNPKFDQKNAYEKYLKLVARACIYTKYKIFDNPDIVKVIPESKFIINVSPGITINGLIDITMIKKAPDGSLYAEIVDWKGGSSFYVSKEQLQFYGIATMALFGLPVKKLSFVYPGESNKEVPFPFKDRDYEGLIYKMQMVSVKLAENHRVPASSLSLCKWCKYKTECEEKPKS